MRPAAAIAHVHGPFDGDFDPFEEDEDPGARPRTRQLGEAEGRRRALNKHC